MTRFRVVLIEHGYSSVEHERQIISAGGGEFIDADSLPLGDALRLCAEAEGILCRRLEITAAMIQSFRRLALKQDCLSTDHRLTRLSVASLDDSQ